MAWSEAQFGWCEKRHTRTVWTNRTLRSTDRGEENAEPVSYGSDQKVYAKSCGSKLRQRDVCFCEIEDMADGAMFLRQARRSVCV